MSSSARTSPSMACCSRSSSAGTLSAGTRGSAVTPPGTTTPRPNLLPHSAPISRRVFSLCQPEPRGGHREPGGVGELAQDVEVVGDALQLGVQHPDQRGRDRDVSAGEGLHCVREGQRVRHRRDTFDSFGDQHTRPRRSGLRTASAPRGACSAAGSFSCGMSSPGVSIRYSMDSKTPERTGPCGMVNTPVPCSRADSARSSGSIRSGWPADAGGGGDSRPRSSRCGRTNGSNRGCPSGTTPDQVVQRPLVPERRRQLRRQAPDSDVTPAGRDARSGVTPPSWRDQGDEPGSRRRGHRGRATPAKR